MPPLKTRPQTGTPRLVFPASLTAYAVGAAAVFHRIVRLTLVELLPGAALLIGLGAVALVAGLWLPRSAQRGMVLCRALLFMVAGGFLLSSARPALWLDLEDSRRSLSYWIEGQTTSSRWIVETGGRPPRLPDYDWLVLREASSGRERVVGLVPQASHSPFRSSLTIDRSGCRVAYLELVPSPRLIAKVIAGAVDDPGRLVARSWPARAVVRDSCRESTLRLPFSRQIAGLERSLEFDEAGHLRLFDAGRWRELRPDL